MMENLMKFDKKKKVDIRHTQLIIINVITF